MGAVVTVRDAGPADAFAVARLVTEAGLPTAGLDCLWRAVVVDDDTDGLHRWGDPARLAGVAALERHGAAGQPVFLLRSVAVRADWRGRGLGAALVAGALQRADADVGGLATVALLTETADGYFGRFGFMLVPRAGLPTALAGSPELTGTCPASARAYLRSPRT